jgi:hypothetical protein
MARMIKQVTKLANVDKLKTQTGIKVMESGCILIAGIFYGRNPMFQDQGFHLLSCQQIL